MESSVALKILLVNWLLAVLKDFSENGGSSLMAKTGNHKRSSPISIGCVKVKIVFDHELHKHLDSIEYRKMNDIRSILFLNREINWLFELFWLVFYKVLQFLMLVVFCQIENLHSRQYCDFFLLFFWLEHIRKAFLYIKVWLFFLLNFKQVLEHFLLA